jgi:hypothetical protein
MSWKNREFQIDFLILPNQSQVLRHLHIHTQSYNSFFWYIFAVHSSTMAFVYVASFCSCFIPHWKHVRYPAQSGSAILAFRSFYKTMSVVWLSTKYRFRGLLSRRNSVLGLTRTLAFALWRAVRALRIWTFICETDNVLYLIETLSLRDLKLRHLPV